MNRFCFGFRVGELNLLVESGKRIYILTLALALVVTMPLWSVDVSPEEYAIIQEFAARKKNDRADSEQFLHKSLQTNRTAPLLFQAALIEVDKNNPQKASEYFSEIIKMNPQFPGAYTNRGRLQAMLGNYEKAIGDLLRGINVDESNKETLAILHQVYLAIEEPIAAEIMLRWALLRQPKDPELHTYLAYNLLQQGRYAEAEKIAEHVIALGAQNFTPWTILTNALISQKKSAKAIDVLEEACLLHDTLPEELDEIRGDLYLQEGLMEEAMSVFLNMHQRKPLVTSRILSLLETLLAVGDGENASIFATIARKEAPERAESFYFSAQAAKLVGNDKKAIDYAKQAVALDSGLGEAFLFLGELYKNNNNINDALQTLRIARSFGALKIRALRLELELWIEQEQWQDALSTLELLSQIDDRNDWKGMMVSILDFIQE